MAVKRFWGFEHGSDNDCYGSDVSSLSHFSVSTTKKRNGRRALRGNANNIVFKFIFGQQWVGSGGWTADQANKVGPPAFTGGSAWLTVWMLLATQPDVDTAILNAQSGASTVNGTQNDNIFRVLLKSDGTLQLQYNSGTDASPTWNNVGSPSAAISLNTWNRIDFSAEQVKNSQAGTAATELKLNGTQVARGTGLTINTTNPQTADAMDCFKLTTTNSGAGNTIDIYWDDAWLDDAAFADNDGGVTVSRPNAAGNYTGWGGAYTDLDESVNDGSTTELSVTAAAASTFGFQSASESKVGGSIKAIRVLTITKRTSATNVPKYNMRVRSGSTDSDSTAKVGDFNTPPTTYNGYGGEYILATDPATSAAWTSSGYDGVEAGANQTAASTSCQWTQLFIEVWSTAPQAQPAVPTITSISPNSGPKAGGTAVTITGEFFTGATSANIGGLDLTSFTVVSDTSITGTTAAASKAGTYLVTVVGAEGNGSLTSGFTYTPGNSGGQSGNNAGGSTSLVVNMPSTATGEQLIAVITVRGTGTTVTQSSWGTAIDIRSDGTNSSTHTFKRVSTGGSEPSTYTFTLGTSVKASGVITSTPDVDTGASIQVSSQANASSANVVAPSLTPRRLGAVSIYGGGTATGTTFTPPSSYTEPANSDNASTGGSAGTRTTTEQAYRQLTSVAATGTLTGVAGAAATNVGVQVLLDPPTTITPPSIASAEFVSNPTVSLPVNLNRTIQPTAIASAESVAGGGTRLDPIQLQNQGITSGESVPTPIIQRGLSPTAINSAETIGSHTLKATATILPTAIDTAEAIGSHTLIATAVILPGAIASAEVVPNPTLVVSAVGFTISPTAIPDPGAFDAGGFDPGGFNEQFGRPNLYATATIQPTAIGSAEAFGSHTLIPGGVIIAPSAIPSAESVGVPTLTVTLGSTILPSAIDSAEAIGSHTLKATANILPTAIDTAETVGNHTLIATANILPTAIPSAESVGTPTLIATANILPTAINSGEAIGSHTLLHGGVTVLPSSIPTAEAVGTPSLLASATILPTAIASGEVIGSHTLKATNVIQPTAIPSAESVGNPTLIPGSVRIIVNGIASGEAIGTHIVNISGGPQVISVGGIQSAEVVDSPTVLPGGVSISPASVGPQDAYGTPVVIHGMVVIAPTAVPSGEAFGNPTLLPGGVTATVGGINTGEVLGLPSLIATNLIVPETIAGAEVFGLPQLTPGGIFIIVGGINSAEQVGHPTMRRGRVTWQWVNRSPGWRTTRELSVPTIGDKFAHTRRNEDGS